MLISLSFLGRWLWGILSARLLFPLMRASGSPSPSPSLPAVSPLFRQSKAHKAPAPFTTPLPFSFLYASPHPLLPSAFVLPYWLKTQTQGWFIFTTIIVIATLRSNLALFFVFFCLDLVFLLLGIGYLHRDAKGSPNISVIKAASLFSLLTAFAAWYCALAGLLNESNRYVLFSLSPFPSSTMTPSRNGFDTD